MVGALRHVFQPPRGWGLADVETNEPMTAATVMQVGSISKQVTAATVVELARQGRLSLDDPLGRHLPQLPQQWQPIPLRALLTMTSGIPEFAHSRAETSFRGNRGGSS